MPHVTMDEVQVALDEVVALFPADHTNPKGSDFKWYEVEEFNLAANGCANTYPDGSHCVAAQMAVHLGLPMTDQHNGPNIERWSYTQEWLFCKYGVTFDGDVERFVCRLQELADGDMPWRQALTETRQEMGR